MFPKISRMVPILVLAVAIVAGANMVLTAGSPVPLSNNATTESQIESQIEHFCGDYVRGLNRLVSTRGISTKLDLRITGLLIREGYSPAAGKAITKMQSSKGLEPAEWGTLLLSPVDQDMVQQLINSDQRDWRVAGVVLLPFIGDGASRERLWKIARDPNEDELVRGAALEGLGRCGTWKDMIDMAKISESKKEPQGLKEMAQGALARFMGEEGRLSVPEFRKRLESLLKATADGL